MPQLAVPTPDLLASLANLPQPIIEIGAGEGRWLMAMRQAGIACHGVDIDPRGGTVERGDHHTAPQGPTMLAVWPPWGVLEWINERPWEAVAVVGKPALTGLFHDPIDGYEMTEELDAPGRQGGSLLRIWRRS